MGVLLLKERNSLLKSLKEKEFQAEVLGEENKKLLNENEALKRDIESKAEIQENVLQKNTELTKGLQASEEKMMKLDMELKSALQRIEELNSEIAAVKNDNIALKAENESLKNAAVKPKKKK